MKKNKIVWIVFFTILSFVIFYAAWPFVTLIVASKNGYVEVFHNKSILDSYFKEKCSNNFSIEWSYQNKNHSKIICLNKNDQLKVIVWDLKELIGIRNDSVIFDQVDYIGKDDSEIYNVLSTHDDPLMIFLANTKFSSENTIYFNIDQSTEIVEEEHDKKMSSYLMNMSQIGFSQKRGENDLVISVVDSLNVVFLISTRKNKFVCYLFYTDNSEKLTMEWCEDMICG